MKNYLGKIVRVTVDRPIGYVHGDIVYPINYGFLPGTLAGDGEEQDAYILGVQTPISEFEGCVIGIVIRKNDCEDKLVVAPAGMVFHQAQIAEAVAFQEQYFDVRIVSVFEKSCGVLTYRVVDGQREFLLVFEQFSHCWSIPKGHMEIGETEIQTALRELQEETGLSAVIDPDRCASIVYPISQVAQKEVKFFLGRVCGTPHAREGEIEGFRWVREGQLRDYLFPDTADACLQLLR